MNLLMIPGWSDIWRLQSDKVGISCVALLYHSAFEPGYPFQLLTPLCESLTSLQSHRSEDSDKQ